MNYIITESQLQVIVESKSLMVYLRRVAPKSYDEVTNYMKSNRRFRELNKIDFMKRFFSTFMDIVHPYLTSRYGEDWDYDLVKDTLKEAYNDDVVELWEKIHEK